MIIRYFNNKSKVINKEHMDPEIVNQRNQFPGNEPMYIVLLLIVILSLIMLLFLWLLSFIARVEVTFRILVIINLLAANFLQTLGFILNFSFEHNRKYYPYFDSTFLWSYCSQLDCRYEFCGSSNWLWIYLCCCFFICKTKRT